MPRNRRPGPDDEVKDLEVESGDVDRQDGKRTGEAQAAANREGDPPA